MNESARTVFTIGHSTHTFETFVSLLRSNAVTALADVRSAPFSRFNPQFNRDALEAGLKAQGIRYVFLGRELGARSDDPTCYENGRVQYQRLAQTALFQSGLERVMQGALKHQVALVCAEKEPLECHRTLLVARALVERGVDVAHILSDGRLERHDATMARLLDLVGLPQQDLFRTREQLIEEALRRQGEKVAYVVEKPAGESGGSKR